MIIVVQPAFVAAGGGPTSYYANSANWTGYRFTDNARPPTTEVADTETELSGAQKNTISTDDNNFHSQAGDDGGLYYGHRVTGIIAENRDAVTQIDVTVKGYGYDAFDEVNIWYLYIWRFSTNSYIQLGTHSQGSKQTLTSTITTNITNYIDTDGGMSIAVAGGVGGGFEINGFSNLYYGVVTITT